MPQAPQRDDIGSVPRLRRLLLVVVRALAFCATAGGSSSAAGSSWRIPPWQRAQPPSGCHWSSRRASRSERSSERSPSSRPTTSLRRYRPRDRADVDALVRPQPAERLQQAAVGAADGASDGGRPDGG